MIPTARRVATLAALSTALFGASALISTAASAATPATASAEAQVVARTNQTRAKAGCRALRVDGRLTAAARAHSADMARYKYLSHTGRTGTTFKTRAQRAGYRSAVGENIAYGYRTPDAVTTAWVKSPGHYRNITNCKAKAIGVGLARRADGTPYWTQIFGSA